MLSFLFYRLLRRPSNTQLALDKLRYSLIEKQQEIEQLQQQKNRFKTVSDNSERAIAISDINGNILYANDILVSQTGYAREQIIGRTPSLFRSQHTPLSIHKRLWHQILTGNKWSGKICNKHSDGSLYWIDLIIFPVEDHLGKIVEFAAISSPCAAPAEKPALSRVPIL